MSGPGWHFFGEEEIAEVLEVLNSRQLSRYRFGDTDGQSQPKVYQFERAIEQSLNVKHCLALNSCTSALQSAMAALGIGPGDEVIVPAYTFIASIAAVAHARATPVLAEIDESLTISPQDIERRITSRTKAIVAVHMLGAPCAMDEIMRIAKAHHLFVIEDVAQACGASYRGTRLGGIGDVGAFSLNIFKIITAGDGGMLTTHDTQIYERAFAFHDHGSKPFRLGLADDGSLIGLNLRMNELVGAVALAQARKLDEILARLRRKKALFKSALQQIPKLGFRRLNDEQGECGSILALIFETRELAEAVAKAIGSKTLLSSGKHYYGNMVQLLNKNMPTPHGCPFACQCYPTEISYEVGMLPQTDDILSRAINLSVGISDSYLGTDFGINVQTEDDQVIEKAEEFRRRTEHLLS